jgi:P2 family phage contractile tail tube protein
MATNKVPEVINDVRIYLNGSDTAVAATKIELPEIKTLTADVTGIGLAGKVEAPIQGHFDSMECTISWNVPTKDNSQLFGGEAISLEAYADVQAFDGGESKYIHDQFRVAMRGRIKSHKVGSLEPGSTADAETVIEVHYIKEEMAGKVLAEVDKYGYKCIINGNDIMAPIRANLGL